MVRKGMAECEFVATPNVCIYRWGLARVYVCMAVWFTQDRFATCEQSVVNLGFQENKTVMSCGLNQLCVV